MLDGCQLAANPSPEGAPAPPPPPTRHTQPLPHLTPHPPPPHTHSSPTPIPHWRKVAHVGRRLCWAAVSLKVSSCHDEIVFVDGGCHTRSEPKPLSLAHGGMHMFRGLLLHQLLVFVRGFVGHGMRTDCGQTHTLHQTMLMQALLWHVCRPFCGPCACVV